MPQSYVDDNLFRRKKKVAPWHASAPGPNVGPQRVAVVSRSSLQKTLRRAGLTAPEPDYSATRRARLAASGKNRTAGWNNTIEKMQEQRTDKYMARRDAAEAKRVEQDVKEAEFRNQQRQDAINRAEAVLYRQRDEVKEFESQLLATRVAEERREHQKIRDRQKDMEKARDAYYHELSLENESKAKEVDVRKAKAAAVRKAEVAAVLRSQKEEAEIRRAEIKVQNATEGRLARAQFDADMAEKRASDVGRVRRAREQARETAANNERLRARKGEDQRLEALQTAQILEFAKEKEAIQDRRKAMETERFQAKQAQRQKIIDDQVERLRVHKKKENARLSQERDAIENAAIEREELEYKLKVTSISENRASLDANMARKKAKKEAAIAAGRRDLAHTQKLSKEREEYDKTMERGRREKAKRLQSLYIQAIRDKDDTHKRDRAVKKILRDRDDSSKAREAEKVDRYRQEAARDVLGEGNWPMESTMQKRHRHKQEVMKGTQKPAPLSLAASVRRTQQLAGFGGF